MAEAGARERVRDLWLALLAGEGPWRDVSDEPSERERAVGALVVIALVVTLVLQWVALAARIRPFDGVSESERILLAAAAASIGSAVVLARRPVVLASSRRVGPTGFGRSVVTRSIAYLVLAGCSAGFLTRFRFLGAMPIGLVAGADGSLTLWALGIEPQPVRWLKRFVFSTIHFGVLGAMLATGVFEPERSATALSLYGALWVGIGLVLATLTAVERLDEMFEAARDRDREDIRSQERDHRAHWLHDDVLSEVRIATLRIGDDADDARKELLDLDHRLRLRQLDEMMRGGAAHIYDVLQPHLRRAQALGVELVRVPSLETTGRVVDERSSRLLHRAVSVLTSNAMNAGATRLAIELADLDDGVVELTVLDDAGGFDLDSVPPGRGLDQLRRDLGQDAVRVRRVGAGSAVSARVRLDSSSSQPSHTNSGTVP